MVGRLDLSPKGDRRFFTKMIARCPLWVTADISLEERHEEHIQTVDDKYQG